MRRLLLTLVAALALLAPVAPAAHAATSTNAVASAPTLVAKHKCTKTSTGKCIRGGQFCPKAKKGKKGWDAKGRVYICKNKHWRKI